MTSPSPGWAGYRDVPGSPEAGAVRTASANRSWWDAAAAGYLAEHGDFLGDAGFVWCPEGLTEDDAGLLGDLRDRVVLEVGCGAAQCSRWVARRGGRVVGVDLSSGMLREGARLSRDTGTAAPLVQADARALPFADASFDVAFSAFGAVPFVADPERVMREVRRVLRVGSPWVFAIPHPLRWAFPDDPGPGGLTATRSYFDRTPYQEQDDDGNLRYAEHHRTLGERVADLVAAGFSLESLVEPPWPRGHDRIWGGWSPLRGRLLPGTAIFVARAQAGASVPVETTATEYGG